MSCCDRTTCCTTPAPTAQASCCTPSSSSCCVIDPASLKARVRADYARVATGSTYNADLVATRFGYTQEDLASIPEGANLGVSCGNPLALTNVGAGEVVVDLGSGGGLDCFLAAAKVGSSGKVFGIDATPEMLARARENAAKRNIRNVEFIHGDIEALPLPDAIADLVISNCVINLVPDKQKAFSEIFRVLKPGGRLAISDIVLKKVLPQEIKSNIALFCSCLAGAIALADLPQLLESAGFIGIIVKEVQVDLNVYKELGGSGSGCCSSLSDTSHPVSSAVSGIDFNEYATSAKIFALK